MTFQNIDLSSWDTLYTMDLINARKMERIKITGYIYRLVVGQ